MENDEATTSGSSPSISFPLGLALLLTLLFCISCFFSCCLYWEKLRSFLLHPPYDYIDTEFNASDDSTDQKCVPSQMILMPKEAKSVPVLMPGNQVPTFIAIACPCEPLH